VNLFKFGAILSLNAQALNTQRCAALTDGKVHPPIMQHPPGVTALMKTLHEAFLFRGAAAVGRQLRPPQQFSTRNPSRAFIRS
jgi:hypothetical protein